MNQNRRLHSPARAARIAAAKTAAWVISDVTLPMLVRTEAGIVGRASGWVATDQWGRVVDWSMEATARAAEAAASATVDEVGP